MMEKKKNKEIERIIVKNLSKKFKIGERKQGVLSYLISLFSGVEPKREIWALKNVSFNVREGENLGIIGKNGSGKTTLVATIGGIYKPDEGETKINGKIVLLSGLGNGLKTKLNVKDNIYLVGSVLGLSQKDIKGKFKEIIEFAGLNDFINAKIYQLSSGMKARLAFSITIHCITHSKPDILVLDEVFGGGGGDEEFKNKGLGKMEELARGRTTIVLASHSLEIIKKYCDKVIWLDKGKIMKEGKAKEVVRAYLKFVRKLKKKKTRK